MKPKHRSVHHLALKENMLKSGLSEEMAVMMVSIGASIRAGEFDVIDPALENLIGQSH